MASVWSYAFVSRDRMGKFAAHRARLDLYEKGRDVGGVSRIALSLPGSLGASSLCHTRKGGE